MAPYLFSTQESPTTLHDICEPLDDGKWFVRDATGSYFVTRRKCDCGEDHCDHRELIRREIVALAHYAMEWDRACHRMRRV